MAFLDNLDKKLTELGQGALQKTKDATDSVKISSSIKGMENQKKECFEQIGKIYYEKYADKAAEAMAETAELIAKINELETAEEELREQMRKIKGTIYCPNCNAEISENSKFCNVCGAKIELPEKVQPVQSPTGKNLQKLRSSAGGRPDVLCKLRDKGRGRGGSSGVYRERFSGSACSGTGV